MFNPFQYIKLNRAARYKGYLNDLAENITVHEHEDKELVERLYKQFDAIVWKQRSVSLVRSLFYVVLYASVLSAFFGQIEFVQFLTGHIKIVSGIIGSAVSFIIVTVLSRWIHLYDVDITFLAAHIMTIYVQHSDSYRKEIIDYLASKEHPRHSGPFAKPSPKKTAKSRS